MTCCNPDWSEAATAATSILKSIYRVDLEKSLDPLNDEDFMVLVAIVAAAIYNTSATVEAASIRGVLQEVLGADFYALTPAQITVIGEAVAASFYSAGAYLSEPLAQIVAKHTRKIARSSVVRGARALGIRTPLLDPGIVDAIGRFGSWIIDDYGTRARTADTIVQRIVARGLAEGLPNDSIGQQLLDIATNAGVVHNQNYWNLVSINITNRARSYGQLMAMKEAGIRGYRLEAVLDGRTSELCWMLHGTEFRVGDALNVYSQLEQQSRGDYFAMDTVMPFPQRRRVGNNTEFSINGTVIGSTDTGLILGSDELASMGFLVPPFHHACRTTIVPI